MAPEEKTDDIVMPPDQGEDAAPDDTTEDTLIEVPPGTDKTIDVEPTWLEEKTQEIESEDSMRPTDPPPPE